MQPSSIKIVRFYVLVQSFDRELQLTQLSLCSSLIRINTLIISFEVSGSKFPVGSSTIKTFGRFTIALAIATLVVDHLIIHEGKH